MVAKKFADLDLLDLETLMKSEFHEERLTALLILVDQYKKGDTRKKDEIFEFYLSHSKNVNNWDLVDSSAPSILGMHLQEKKITLLIMYAKSGDLWRKRIAIVSTLAFIQNKNPTPTFQIADLLLSEKEDLIQKAIGWMLREVGKRISYEVEEEYLKKNYKKMGRTTLRYAIEHFSPEKRKKYLNGII